VGGEVTVYCHFSVPIDLIDLEGDLLPALLFVDIDIDITGVGAEEITQLRALDHDRIEGPLDASPGKQRRNSHYQEQHKKNKMLIL